MSISWDHENFPRRLTEWSSFIDALADQQRGDEKPFEDFWLEQKSQINPLKSPGIGKIAKCLIGMANRQPEVALRAMAGHGLMVCGVDEGARVGVTRTEDHELENALRLFLGDEGPVWTAKRLPADVSDREVLILVVDPPKAGDPIHVSLRESEGITDGGIFVRSKTHTRHVYGREHQALVRRMLSGSNKQDLSITVDLVTPIYGAVWEPTLLENYVRQERTSLLSSLNRSQSASQSLDRGYLGSLVGGYNQKQETRTEDEFHHEVQAWVDDCLLMTDYVADAYLAHALPPAVFRVTNQSDVFVKNVELLVHLEGEVKSTLHRDDPRFRVDQYLPDRPRAYGPYTEPPRGVGLPASMYPGSMWRSSFTSGGSVDAVFDMAALRPRGDMLTSDDDSVLYLPGGKQRDIVHATWALTAENIDGRYEGEFDIALEAGIRLGDNLINHRVLGIRKLPTQAKEP